MVYSATSASAALANGDPAYYLKRQAIYALPRARADGRRSRASTSGALRALAPTLVVTSLGLLLAVLVLGQAVNGARRWITFGPAVFQPSELAKLALAVWAAVLPRPPPRAADAEASSGARSGSSTVVFCGLILVEPDLGTAIAIVVDARRDAARLRHAGAHARRGPRHRGHARPRRRLARAVPPRAPLQLPQPVARRPGRRLPDRAGDDRPRLRRDLRPSASARASRRSTTCPRPTRT